VGRTRRAGSLFSYVDLDVRIPARNPRRKIRQVVNDALASLDAEFEALYTNFDRRSILPERLIRASLIQILFSVRSERQLREQMEYNLLFRWFVGLDVADPVCVPTVFSRNRDRLLTTEMPRGNPAFGNRRMHDPAQGLRAVPEASQAHRGALRLG
jgi:transposase